LTREAGIWVQQNRRGRVFSDLAMKRVPVFNPVAEERWEYQHAGQTWVVHLAIGRPFTDRSGEWFCPLKVDGAHQKTWRGWKPIAGKSPFDAVMNALLLASRMLHGLSPRPMPMPQV
jgi:hypothetical protein